MCLLTICVIFFGEMSSQVLCPFFFISFFVGGVSGHIRLKIRKEFYFMKK